MADEDREIRERVHYDLNISDATGFGDYLSIQDIRSPTLKLVWQDFQDNVERIRLMSLLPQYIVSSAVLHLLPLTQAVFNVLNKPVMDDDELEPNREAISAEYSKIADHFFDERPMVQHTFSTDSMHYTRRNVIDSPLTRDGFVALLEAQVIGIWTLFETFANDLFMAAAVLRPGPLNNLGKKKIELSEVLKLGIEEDFANKIRGLVKQSIPLASLANLRDSYERFFETEDITKIINAPEIELASLVRNQLIHENGKASAQFAKDTARLHIRPWHAVRVGERLYITGSVTAQIAKGVIARANQLILFVDKWAPPQAEPDSK